MKNALSTQPRRGPRIEGQSERTGITVGEVIKGSMVSGISSGWTTGTRRIGKGSDPACHEPVEPLPHGARCSPAPRGNRLPIGTETGGFDHLQALAQARRKRRLPEHRRDGDLLFGRDGDHGRDGLFHAAPLPHSIPDRRELTCTYLQQMFRLIPPGSRLILIDEKLMTWEGTDALFTDRHVLPFLERDGEFWGRPANDDVAIHELERLRGDAVRYIVFTREAFWWENYYTGFFGYLRGNFECLCANDGLLIFDMERK